MISLLINYKKQFDRISNSPEFIKHALLGRELDIGQELEISKNIYTVKSLPSNKYLNRVNENSEIEILQELSLKFQDFPVKGLQHLQVQECIQEWERNNFRNSNLLITGKSGTGKTLLTRHLPVNIYSRVCQAHQLLYKQNFSSIIQEMVEFGPSILVIEDVDLILNQTLEKESIYTSQGARLLQLYKGLFDDFILVENGIFIIGTTRRPQDIPQNIFNQIIAIQGTSKNSRFEILKEISKNSFRNIKGNSLNDGMLQEIAHLTHGYTGSDLQNLFRHVLIEKKLQKKDLTEVNIQDFRNGIKVVRPAGLSEYAAKVGLKWKQ